MTDEPRIVLNADSTSTPEEYAEKLWASIRAEYPEATIHMEKWVTEPRGFWRRLLHLPARGHYVSAGSTPAT